jgi:hypothetical protein
MKPKRPMPVIGAGDLTMMIYMLAVAMTITMLIATAFAMHRETQRSRLQEKRASIRKFWPR